MLGVGSNYRLATGEQIGVVSRPIPVDWLSLLLVSSSLCVEQDLWAGCGQGTVRGAGSQDNRGGAGLGEQ